MMEEFSNPLPGVPAVESPFFDRMFGASNIDPEVVRVAQSLRRDGYAIIDFPDPDLPAMAERIKQSLHSRFDWAEWLGGATEFNGRAIDAWAENDDVRRIASNPAVLSLLEALYGRPAFPFQTLDFCVGTQQHVHSDSVHFSSSPERFMCGVWVALEDIDADNGPLVYYPGSQRWPIYTNEHIGVNATTLTHTYEAYPRYEATWRALIEANGVEPQRFFAKKGQALIWAANLLHGGDTHLDRNRTRWSQVTHYYFDGCVYQTPLLSDPYYGRIYFREPTDIATGTLHKNVVSGLPVPDAFIASVSANAAQAAPPPAPVAEPLPEPPVQQVTPLRRLARRLLR